MFRGAPRHVTVPPLLKKHPAQEFLPVDYYFILKSSYFGFFKDGLDIFFSKKYVYYNYYMQINLPDATTSSILAFDPVQSTKKYRLILPAVKPVRTFIFIVCIALKRTCQLCGQKKLFFSIIKIPQLLIFAVHVY